MFSAAAIGPQQIEREGVSLEGWRRNCVRFFESGGDQPLVALTREQPSFARSNRRRWRAWGAVVRREDPIAMVGIARPVPCLLVLSRCGVDGSGVAQAVMMNAARCRKFGHMIKYCSLIGGAINLSNAVK